MKKLLLLITLLLASCGEDYSTGNYRGQHEADGAVLSTRHRMQAVYGAKISGHKITYYDWHKDGQQFILTSDWKYHNWDTGKKVDWQGKAW